MIGVRRRAFFAMGLLAIALGLGLLGIFDVIGPGYLIAEWVLLGIAIVILTIGHIQLRRARRR